jgi:chorismate mutase
VHARYRIPQLVANLSTVLHTKFVGGERRSKPSIILLEIMVKLLAFATGIIFSPFAMAFATWGPPIPNHYCVLPASLTTTVNDEKQNGSSTTVVDMADEEHLKTVDVLSLESIRSSLIRQEETIIFAMIERAQFRHNEIVYRKGGFGSLGIPAGSYDPGDGEELSFMEYMLVGTEALHCGARRYLSPEEHPFFPERLPAGPMEALPLLQYRNDLLSSQGGASELNFNKRLLNLYVERIVSMLCKPGDDEQHGSTALCDIAVLQALSRRVHYGKFVAESKYRSDPEGYQRLVNAGDAKGVMKLLTNTKVEEKVLRRARLKAATYGMEPLLSELPPIEGSDATSIMVAAAAASAVVAALGALDSAHHTTTKGKVDPDVIAEVYRDFIIPMTKDIEVAYLFRRCGKEPPPEYLE